MLLIRYDKHGAKRIVDLHDLFVDQTAILVGAAPSLKEQPIHLLESPGVLTMAMNNAALHFRPVLWSSSDNPACFAKEILFDPRIIKFAPILQATNDAYGVKYKSTPNTFFYIQEDNVPWSQFFAMRNTTPWYNNTLFVSIYLLYMLGIRRIILAGSDFGKSTSGSMYAHATQLPELADKWNIDLYNSLVRELRQLKPVFEENGLELMDCSKNSRLASTYEHITLERAVDICLSNFPNVKTDPKTLPHASAFATEDIKNAIAKWPGHNLVDYDIIRPATDLIAPVTII